MDSFISKEALWRHMNEYANAALAENRVPNWNDAIALIGSEPEADVVPICPLSSWLAGFAVPPAYTIGGVPYKSEDAARRRAEGWETHIHNLMDCGLMDDE